MQWRRSTKPVLILIILEYIYIKKLTPYLGNAKTVLILIILEYIYITLSKKKEIAAGVLILIILEYIYIYISKGIRWHNRCLNPYYTGIHLHKYGAVLGLEKRVLILIILEYIYISYFGNVQLKWELVLILIILEYIYIENKERIAEVG